MKLKAKMHLHIPEQTVYSPLQQSEQLHLNKLNPMWHTAAHKETEHIPHAFHWSWEQYRGKTNKAYWYKQYWEKEIIKKVETSVDT